MADERDDAEALIQTAIDRAIWKNRIAGTGDLAAINRATTDAYNAREALRARLAEADTLRDKVDRLEEAAAEPPVWPKWASDILETLEKYGCPYEPDDVDLPVMLAEWIDGYDNERATRDAVARAEAAEAENARLRERLEFIRDNGMTSTKELLVKEAERALARGGDNG